jgi:hypothetical protein
MNYSKKFIYFNELVQNDIYVYKKGAANVLFIGACRSYVYAIYFEEICKYVPWFKHAQFGISAIGVHIIDLLKRQKTKNIINVIENADIIICEQIRHYNFLNTSKKCEQNIFNNFNIKPQCVIVQVPNLEFRYYYKELQFENLHDAHDNNKVKFVKENNLNKFIEHCRKYNFEQFGKYVLQNINNKRLFVVFNHPCNHTILEAVKLIVKNGFHQELLPPILSILRRIRIFDDDTTSKTFITNNDYELGLARHVS